MRVSFDGSVRSQYEAAMVGLGIAPEDKITARRIWRVCHSGAGSTATSLLRPSLGWLGGSLHVRDKESLFVMASKLTSEQVDMG